MDLIINSSNNDSTEIELNQPGKRKINRPSWKTEYETVFKLKEKLRVQRNLAVAFAACYLLVDIIFRIFS